MSHNEYHVYLVSLLLVALIQVLIIRTLLRKGRPLQGAFLATVALIFVLIGVVLGLHQGGG